MHKFEKKVLTSKTVSERRCKAPKSKGVIIKFSSFDFGPELRSGPTLRTNGSLLALNLTAVTLRATSPTSPRRRHPRERGCCVGDPGNFFTLAPGSRTLRKAKLRSSFSKFRDAIWLWERSDFCDAKRKQERPGEGYDDDS
jgi:hypothetical protein